METITPLCASVRERLRSCVTVPSVAQCVEELVLNAVDASATCVAVRLHLPAGRVTLVDNGTGISRENMDMVGQRYATSKCHTTADLSELCHYGYRGEALASIRDTCLLMEISSRHCQSTQTYTRIFKKGEALPVAESSIPRPSKGTTITVHDVFHALPVRKKHMNEALELERIRSRLEAVGLIHPLLSISLRDDVTGNKLIQTHKSNGISGAFSHLFGNHKARPLKEVKAESSCFKVEGFVSMESHHNKNLQFVFINKRLVLKTRIHKLVNDLVGPSTICRRKGRNLKSSPELSKDGTMNVTSSPQKYSDRHGVYVLNISCPYDKYDITFEPTKTLVEFRDWQELLTCVEDLVRTMLVREGIVIKVETSTETSINTVDAADSQEEDEQSKQLEDATTSKDYTKDLNTVNMTNCMHSAAVRRPRTTEEPQSVDDCTPQQDSHKLKEHNQNELEEDMSDVSEAPGEMLTLAADLALSSSPSDKSVTPAILTSPISGNSEDFQVQTRTHTMSSSEDESDENINVDEKRESPTLSQMLEPNTNTIESKVESCSIRQRDHTFISLSSQVSLSMEEFRKAFRRVPVSEDPKIGAPTCSLEGPSNPCKEKGLTPWERIRAEIVKRKLSESEDEEVIVSDSTCRSSKPKLSRINLRKNRISSESVGRQNDTDLRKSFQRSSSEAKANSITCKQQKTQQDRIVQDFNKIKERISEHSSQEMDSQRMEIPDEVKYDEYCQPAVIKDSHRVEMQDDKLTKDINELSCSNRQDAVNGSCMFIKDNSSNIQPEDTNMKALHFQSSPTSDTLANGTIHGLESSKLHVSHCIAENPTLSAKLSRICKRSSSHLDQQTDVKMKYPTRDFLTTETLVNFINFEDVNDERTSSDTQKPEQYNNSCSKNKQSDKSAAVKSSIFDCDTEDEVREYFASKIEAIQKKCALKQVHFGETESVTIHNIQDVPSTPEPNTSKTIEVDPYHEVLPPELSKPKEAEDEYIPMPFAEYASKVLSPCKPCQAVSMEKDCKSRSKDDQYTCDAAQILFKFPPYIRIEPSHTNTYRNNHLDIETLDESGIHLAEISNPNTSTEQASAELPDMATQATESDGNSSFASVQSPAKTNTSQRELDVPLYQPGIPPQSFSPRWARYPKALHSSPSSNMHSCSQSQGFPVESQGFSTDVQLTQPFRPTTLEGQEFEDSGLEADQEMTAGEEMDPLTLKASDGNSVMHHSDVPELSSKPTVESMAAASSKPEDHQLGHCQSTIADEDQNVTLSPPTQETCRKDVQVLNSKSKDVQITATTATDSNAADVDNEIDEQRAHGNESARSESSEKAEGKDSGPQEQTESIIGQQWLCTVDKSGRKLYVHMATGNSTYEEPIVKSDNSTTAQTVPRTHPFRGVAGSILEQFRQQMADSAPSKVSTLEPESGGRMTTLLEEHQGGLAAEGGSKWRTQHQQDGGEQDSTSVTQLFDQWENPVSTSLLQNVLTLGSGPSTSRVVPYTLTKQMLPSIKVLGQMDRKFIMCLMNPDPAKNGPGELLVVIDQHAAHERVRLENLIDEAHEDDPDHPHTLRHTKMVPPIEMTLTQTEVRVMEAYRGQLQRKGLQFSLAAGSRDEVRLLTLPTSLIQREADEAQRGRTPIALQVIETFLKEQVDTLQTSRGGSSVLPQTIMRCLAAEACHGAIKFGDRLTLSQCQELIGSLSDCDLPFQCAHGRPAIMPLIDLGRLKHHYPSTTKARPRLWRLVQKMNEHGDDVDS